MQRRNAAESVINLSQERSQMQLSGKESAGKIADHAGLEVAWVNACVRDGGARGFHDDVADGPALLLEITLEVGASGADDVNRLRHDWGIEGAGQGRRWRGWRAFC